MVVDRNEGVKYDAISAPIFSPDSRRLAYGGLRGNKQFVVVDGKEGEKYDGFQLLSSVLTARKRYIKQKWAMRSV